MSGATIAEKVLAGSWFSCIVHSNLLIFQWIDLIRLQLFIMQHAQTEQKTNNRQNCVHTAENNLEYGGFSIATIQSSETLHQQQRQCRICLQQARPQQSPLLSPCGCTGSLRYVHNQCYKQWIQHIISLKSHRHKNQILQNGFQCQLCKQLVELSLTTRLRCRRWSEFVKVVQNREIIFGLAIIFMIFNLGGIAFLLYIVGKNGISFAQNVLSGIFMLIALLFLFFLASCTLYHLFNEYFLTSQFVFSGLRKATSSNYTSEQARRRNAAN